MAQLVKHDADAIFAQAVGAKTIKDKEFLAAAITAKELSIVWGSDSRYWKWTQLFKTSFGCLDIAELVKVCWLQVDGKYETSKLTKGMNYAVFFVVELKDNLCMNGPVTIKLTRPNGTTDEHAENLCSYPKNQWVALKAGEFKTGCTCAQDVKFSINGCDGTTWKKGLVVIGAAIVPMSQLC